LWVCINRYLYFCSHLSPGFGCYPICHCFRESIQKLVEHWQRADTDQYSISVVHVVHQALPIQNWRPSTSLENMWKALANLIKSLIPCIWQSAPSRWYYHRPSFSIKFFSSEILVSNTKRSWQIFLWLWRSTACADYNTIYSINMTRLCRQWVHFCYKIYHSPQAACYIGMLVAG